MAMEKRDRKQRDQHMCKEHEEEPFKFYCTLHNDVICCICAIKRHKKCNDILTFPEAIERFERENKNLHKALENQSFTMEHAVADKKDHLRNVGAKLTDIRSKLENVCGSLHGTIDVKREEMLQNLQAMEEQITKQVATDVDHLEELARSTARVKIAAEKAFGKSSAVSIIKTMVKVQNAYCDIERSSKGALGRTAKTIDFYPSTEVSEFLDVFESFGTLSIRPEQIEAVDGQTDVCGPQDSVIDAIEEINGFPQQEAPLDENWTPHSVNFFSSPNDSDSSSGETSEESEDILTSGDDNDITLSKSSSSKPPCDADSNETPSLKSSPLTDETESEDTSVIHPTIKTATSATPSPTETKSHFMTVDHGKPCWLYGIAFSTDGRLVISDVAHDSLQLFDAQFKFLSEERVDFTPWGLTSVPDETVAVCAGGKGSIRLFSLKSDKFCPTKQIQVGLDCISVAYGNDTFFIGTRKGATLVSNDGTITPVMDDCMDGQPNPRRADFLTVDESAGRMFITNSWASKITCVSTSGKHVWECCQRDINPRGLAWSRDKLVVVNRNQNRVISMDNDGTHTNDVVADELECPYAIAFLANTNMYAVTQWDEKMGAEQTRIVRLFTCE